MIQKIINISKVITFDKQSENIIFIENPEILIENGIICDISSKVANCENIIDAKKCILTPGFIDSHTHPIFIGDRAKEFSARLNGKTYQDINNEGGGILSSIKMLREASDEELFSSSLMNIKPFIKYGTTTIEAKSGYGLTTKDEIRSLEIIKKINNHLPLDIIPTFLGAHSVPPEYSKSDYINIICNEMIPEIGKRKLAVFCDVFCEKGYFNKKDSYKILNHAKSYGLIPRLHADEFVYSEGAELAKDVNAASADHLMAINNDGIEALASSDVIGTLLPGTTFFLNQNNYADGRKLIDMNCNIALASDFNPGTCTIQSLPKIMLLAVMKCNITIEEAFKGVTINAAKALLKQDSIGVINKGYIADILFWDINCLEEIIYWDNPSSVRLKKVIKSGEVVFSQV
jgi:imidazolonepropionase